MVSPCFGKFYEYDSIGNLYTIPSSRRNVCLEVGLCSNCCYYLHFFVSD